MIGRDYGTFSIKSLEHTPQAWRVTFVWARFNSLDPLLSISDFDCVVALCVEFLYLWVSKGRGADGVSFNNESFGGFSEVRYHVRGVTSLGEVLMKPLYIRPLKPLYIMAPPETPICHDIPWNPYISAFWNPFISGNLIKALYIRKPLYVRPQKPLYISSLKPLYIVASPETPIYLPPETALYHDTHWNAIISAPWNSYLSWHPLKPQYISPLKALYVSRNYIYHPTCRDASVYRTVNDKKFLSHPIS